jgi:hypothetical protein
MMRIGLVVMALLTLVVGMAVIATGLAGPVIAPDAPSAAAGSETIVGSLPSAEPSAAPSDVAGTQPTAAASAATFGAGGHRPTPSASHAAAAPSLDNGHPGVRLTGPRWVTRVVVPSLLIDLPVVQSPPPPAFPPCNVAMYLPSLHQPGQSGATYLFAHARIGMFLPILEASQSSNGLGMLGMAIRVYTSDDRYWDYKVVQVRRHQHTITDALKATQPELWLQTSEGPTPAYPKVQLVALPVGGGESSPDAAQPEPHPINCT